MLTDDYLTLRSVRLVGAETWEPREPGLRFVFIRGGAGVFTISSAKHRLTQGDVFVFRAGSSGNLCSMGDAELVFSMFSVLVEHMFPLFSVSEISQLQNLMDNFKPARFYAAGSPLATDCQQVVGTTPPQFNLDHRAHLLRIVALILGEEFKSLRRGQPGFVSMEQHLMQVFEKLSANDLLTLSTDELSAKFGCSRRHLSRLFHQHFGFSVAALRMELRMLRAVSLLRDAQFKVNQVAQQCGFNHLGLFNNCFKRRFGASPGRWRAQSLAPRAANPAPAIKQPDCPLQSNGMCPVFGASHPHRPLEPAAVHLKNSTLGAALSHTTELDELMGQTTPLPPPLARPFESVYHTRFNATA